MGLDRKRLKDLHCWWGGDSVTGDEEVTRFRRRARWHQCHWRTEQNIEMGYQTKKGKRYPNGAMMLPTDDNRGCNFLSDAIAAAVAHRLSYKETPETLDEERLRFHLLSSMPMCFNLFGEIWQSRARDGSSAVHELWGCDPNQPVEVKFEHSPGRLKKQYIGDLTAFDVALLVGDPAAPRTVIGIETKYHECALPEAPPNTDTRLPRYLEVVDKAGIFRHGWERAVFGTPLQQIWRDHLLLLSMLQEEKEKEKVWAGGRYVLVHPRGNPAFAKLAEHYRELLTDDSTFQVCTVEDLLEAKHPETRTGLLLTEDTATLFKKRYLFDDCPDCDPGCPTC